MCKATEAFILMLPLSVLLIPDKYISASCPDSLLICADVQLPLVGTDLLWVQCLIQARTRGKVMGQLLVSAQRNNVSALRCNPSV